MVFYVEDLDQNLVFQDVMFVFRFSGLICVSPGINIIGSRSVLGTDGKFPSHTEERREPSCLCSWVLWSLRGMVPSGYYCSGVCIQFFFIVAEKERFLYWKKSLLNQMMCVKKMAVSVRNANKIWTSLNLRWSSWFWLFCLFLFWNWRRILVIHTTLLLSALFHWSKTYEWTMCKRGRAFYLNHSW